MLFGDWSFAAEAERAIAAVRDPSNFHWSILTLFALVLTTYCSEIKAKNYKAVACAAMLYSIHWLYEIANAVICHFTGYALWTVSPESTSFILLIGVSAELSLMFSISGFTCKLLPEDPKAKICGINSRWFLGIAFAASAPYLKFSWHGPPLLSGFIPGGAHCPYSSPLTSPSSWALTWSMTCLPRSSGPPLVHWLPSM